MPGEVLGHWPSAGLQGQAALQRPERARVVRLGIIVGQAGRPLRFYEHAAAGQLLHHAADDLVQHRLQRLIGVRRHLDEGRLAVVAPIHAVEHQAVQVNIQVGGRPEALDERDRAAVGLLG